MEVDNSVPVEPENSAEVAVIARKRPIIEEEDEMAPKSSIVAPATAVAPNNNKNNSSTIADDISSPSAHKPRLNVSKEAKVDRSAVIGKSRERWRPHRMMEDYVNLVGDLMYPNITVGPYGYDPSENRFPLDKVPTLGYLLNPLRRPTVFELWNPREVALFEAAITLYGKKFHLIQKSVKTKNVKEIIEFYYDWKKTNHYRQWKKNFVADERDMTGFYPGNFRPE